MGCATSRVENEELVARCKSRRQCMKRAVRSRHEFAAAHGFYLQALRNTGAALRQFAEGESMEMSATSSLATPCRQQQQHQYRHYPSMPRTLPPPPPPPPEMSPYRTVRSNDSSYSSGTTSKGGEEAGAGGWTSTQHANTPPPPPPPPPAQASAWEFWDPFRASSPPVDQPRRAMTTPAAPMRFSVSQEERRRVQEWEAEAEAEAQAQEWEDTTTTVTTTTDLEYERERVHHENAKSPEPQTDDNSSMVSSWYTKDSDLAMVISRTRKDLGAVVRELDEYFLKACAAGNEVSRLLETHFQAAIGEPMKGGHHSAKVFSALSSWGWPSKSPMVVSRDSISMNKNERSIHGSHCSTLERLYAWEKKLYDEVRCRESTKREHDKKVVLLRKQELKGEDELKIEKTKAAIKRLQSQIMVAFQAVDTTSAAILKLREDELYPQLVELSKGLMQMWRAMYECHQVQNHIVQQVRHLGNLASAEATSSYHQQATIQLEAQVTAWYDSFCRMIKSQREYMRALSGWLRLSLNQFKYDAEGIMEHHQPLYTLCEEWQLALDRLPDQSACGGIKSFMTVMHAIVVQQAEELKQARKCESLSKELEKKLTSLRNMETKYYDPYAPPDSRGTDLLARKKAKTEALGRRVEEEKSKHLKAIAVSRAMTLNNLQTGLPNVFQAMTGFSSVCMQAFETVHNQTKTFHNNSFIRRLT